MNDFNSGQLSLELIKQWRHHQASNYVLSREPLARALGLDKRKDKTLWDATAGQAKDLFLILSFGVDHVVAFERSEIIAYWLKEAFDELRQKHGMTSVLEKLTFVYGDCRDSTLPAPDILYYDPMYEDLKGKSLPKKNIQLFRHQVGKDLDTEVFMSWAIKHAREGVVVKRPLKSKPLREGVNHSLQGKTTRYDVYLSKRPI